MSKLFVATYAVKGKVQDGSKLYVELLDNDQHWFDDRIDDLLGSAWTDNSGFFEISFDDSLYKDNWFEGKPELFLVIRDNLGKIIHKTGIQSPSSPDDTENITFDIAIPDNRSLADNNPYDSANTSRIAAFARIGDTIDFTENIPNSTRLLMQTLNAWLLYTNETKWNLIGYDGPQVERYPWRHTHSHKLKWNNL